MNETDLQHEEAICREVQFNTNKEYQLGSYLYMGMALKNGKKVCISVGYTITYCIKKVNEYLQLDGDMQFAHVSKIRIGEKNACQKFYPTENLKRYYDGTIMVAQ